MSPRHARSLPSLAAAAALLVAGVTSPIALAEDWPHFQGPRYDNRSAETPLLEAWPEGGPRKRWEAELGEGYAGVAVRDGEVYMLDRIGQQKDVLRCWGLADGREKWRYEYDAPGKTGYPGSRATPALDDAQAYTVGPFGHITAVGRKDGRAKWTRSLTDDFGVGVPGWGFSQSPLLVGEHVVVAPQTQDTGLVALKKQSGEVAWKSPGIGGIGYVSPVLMTLSGKEQIVMQSKDGVVGVDPADGRVLWRAGFRCSIPIPTPTLFEQNKLFVTGGYRAGSAVFEVRLDDGRWSVSERMRSPIGSQIPPAMMVDGLAYLKANTNDAAEGLVCMKPDGTVLWQDKEQRGKGDKGHLMLADGRLIDVNGQTGVVSLVRPSGEGYRAISRAKLIDGRELWAPIALSDGVLLLRGSRKLVAYQIGR